MKHIYIVTFFMMSIFTAKQYKYDFYDNNEIATGDIYSLTIDIGWQKIPNEEIAKLAQSGRICEVIGHRWEIVPWLYAMENYEMLEEQKCSICGKSRARHMTDWYDPNNVKQNDMFDTYIEVLSDADVD